ncbi:MAG: hemolysin family protein [Dehalococcoidia bacterium]|nr:hemolysin family protein [Dehalococcoidia bacterium]
MPFQALVAPLAPAAEEGFPVGGLNAPIAAVIFAVAVFFYALVNSIEISIVAADRIRLRHLIEGGSAAAGAIERLRARRDLFFAGIVLLQNLFVVVAAAMASALSVDAFGGVGLALGTLATTLLLAVVGEATPKVLAAQATERCALVVARPTELLIDALYPLVWLIAAVPRVLGRIVFGEAAGATPTVTEAELRTMIDIGTEEKVLGERTGELLERVFQFRDRQVQEIMVPRPDVVWLESGMTVGEMLQVFDRAPHSRFPVYSESIDNVVGVVGIKDVLRAIGRGEVTTASPIDPVIRPTYFIPETKPIGSLFWEMQAAGRQMAIVVDEYGGTAGIVTAEILLEAMVGPVADELRGAVKEFQTIDEKTVQVDAGMSVSEANDELGLDIPEGRYETIAGYVLERLGHIPREGETVSGDGFTMVVSKMDGVKVERVLIRRA